jgi:DNA polymerase-3 subunit alpha
LEPETDGQAVGFADTRVTIPDTEFAKAQRMAFEKEMLGLYISDHPLLGLEGSLARLTDCTLADLRDTDPDGGGLGAVGYGGDGQIRTVGGVVTELSRRYTKKGDLMATFVLEDLNASIEAFVFPKAMTDYGALLDDDAIVVVRGRADMRDDRLKLVCMEVQRPDLAVDGSTDLRIALPLHGLTDRTVDGLKRLLAEHPGDSPVLLHVGEKVLRLPSEFNVDSRRGLVGELRVLLGPHAILA